MEKRIAEPISVSLVFDHKKRRHNIAKILWKNQIHKITKHGLHHTYKKGDTTIHIFSVASDELNFRLLLNGSSLIWTLDRIYDPNIV